MSFTSITKYYAIIRVRYDWFLFSLIFYNVIYAKFTVKVLEIAELMSKSSDAVKQKLSCLGLKVVTLENSEGTTTSCSALILPEDLPSIEMTLLKLVVAMKALEDPKLTKNDVMRLRTLARALYLLEFVIQPKV